MQLPSGVLPWLLVALVPSAASVQEIDTSKVDITKQDMGMGADEVCSACHWTSENLRFSLSEKVKKSASRSEREALAISLLDAEAPCLAERYPKHLVLWKTAGWNQYVDYMASKAPAEGFEGSVADLFAKAPSMVPLLQKACRLVLQKYRQKVIDVVGEQKGRIGGFNFQRWLCFHETRYCPSNRTKGAKEAEEDDEAGEL
eukprot:gb/GFBE01059309.1/.p1 GENE.gb/GFBE01059309.1/~~gb/GFBE01059309.1/.p1  ORF type:complete len:201 (+),score=63.83 gb/GFBE01059309.1/:1-603(+)